MMKFALKLLVSISLIALLIWKFPISEIFANLQNARISWFLTAFLLGELIILNQAFRWHYLLIVPKEQKPEFGILLKYTTVGYFFNLFAPGGVGGDAYRSIALGRAHNAIANSIASVFVAKIFGLLALCILFWLALPHTAQIPETATWFMVAASLFLIVFCLFIAFNPLKKGKLGHIAEKLREYKKYPFRLLVAMLGSVFTQVLVVLIHFALFKAVGVSVSLSLIFVVIPVTVLLTAIPVSFNGIGVREWSMLSLTAYTINSEQLLASIFLGYALIILQAIQGWIIFVAKKN